LHLFEKPCGSEAAAENRMTRESSVISIMDTASEKNALCEELIYLSDAEEEEVIELAKPSFDKAKDSPKDVYLLSICV
jgi:hypothetical protein